MAPSSDRQESGVGRGTAEILIEEWRMAAKDERSDRDGASIYREVAAELEEALE